ncbi:MAG: glycosyltransferase family 2 protein [Candidatus Cloacimonetes bacterium]|nr:glycosyltransferase family 2 protein [Candidatus Cloacimonadota bacterium]
MQRHKISAFIPVHNVEDIIEECLESIKWVDEIFIVDDFSTDRTIEICKKYSNVKIVQHKYENSGAQRYWGMPQVSNEWVLIIDSDERCTMELRKEIEKILSQNEIKFDGYEVHLKTKFLGKIQNHDRYLGHIGMRLVRKKSYKEYTLKRVHSTLDIKNHSRIRNKKAYIIHIPIRDFRQHLQKIIRYAEWSAFDMFEKGEKAHWYNITIRPFFKFIKHYFIKLGFLDGIRGLILCIIASITVFLKFYYLYILNHQR